MDKIKLKWKIFAFLLGFCALLLLVLWFFQTVLLTDMYKLIRKGEMEKAISLVEENIDSSELNNILENLEDKQEIIVMPTREFIPPPIHERTEKGKQPPETITQTKEFALQNGQSVSLTFYAMITPVDATISTLELQLYMIMGIMLLLSILIAMLISGKVSKPIEDLSKSAKVLANGNYNAEFNGHGFLEIKELSDTLAAAAEELSTVEALRRELLANISHDLRTPLALIYSYAEMMHDFSEEITQEQPQTIMDEAMRLTSLVNDALDISRLETGTMELVLKKYNLSGSLFATAKRIEELVRKDGYVITFHYEQDVCIIADEVKITQVFYNLLINAINYSDSDKHIIVCQSMTEDFVRIEVQDHGEGIAGDGLRYIWDRYYKVDKQHKRAVTGTGLGLSIVKKIIELHGGNCGVESVIGEGSKFWFSLPK